MRSLLMYWPSCAAGAAALCVCVAGGGSPRSLITHNVGSAAAACLLLDWVRGGTAANAPFSAFCAAWRGCVVDCTAFVERHEICARLPEKHGAQEQACVHLSVRGKGRWRVSVCRPPSSLPRFGHGFLSCATHVRAAWGLTG